MRFPDFIFNSKMTNEKSSYIQFFPSNSTGGETENRTAIDREKISAIVQNFAICLFSLPIQLVGNLRAPVSA
jgi:hypothetical protein